MTALNTQAQRARRSTQTGTRLSSSNFRRLSVSAVSRSKKIFLEGSLVFLIVPLILLAGCAGPKAVTQKEALNYGQFVLRQTPSEVDLSALKGKRIVIDPGHGGSFAGAIGPNNLREADVNLGVGLYLWGMLTQAGAEAYLTRVDDTNVYKGDDFDLKKDLQARVEFAQAHNADLFVSLHHNADVQPGAKRNSLETYFKMSDPGPSLDAAQCIHKQLALSLGQTDNAVLPGNYHVLREFPGTAVLGEPSYISHADNSFKLGLAPMQRIEAQAYFLGIAEYFSKGVPRVVNMQPEGTVTNDASPVITASVVADRGVPIDPTSVTMLVDGARVDAVFDQATSQVSYLPDRRFKNGRHVVELSLRNVEGNAAARTRGEFTVAMPPAYVLLSANFRSVPTTSTQPIRLSAKVMDADALPVADGVPVEFRTEEGTVAPSTAVTHGGEAVSYLTPAGTGRMRLLTVGASVVRLSHVINMYARDDASPFFAVTVLDSKQGSPIERALASVDGRPISYSDRAGYCAVAADDINGSSFTITARGYISEVVECSALSDPAVVRLRPIADGLLFGKRFAIDPQCGGEEKGQIGPTGVRESDVNLGTARYLADFLRAAGADVVLTRDSDLTTTPLHRVELAEGLGAELFISVGHGQAAAEDDSVAGNAVAPDLRVTHYPTSEDGARLAQALAASLQAGGVADEATVEPATDFVLTQTSSVAAMISLPGPAAPGREALLREPETARREAYALYCGILEYYGLGKNRTGQLTVRVRAGEEKPRFALLTLDGALTVGCKSGGDFLFRQLIPGEHRLDIFSGDHMLPTEKLMIQAGETAALDVMLPAPGPSGAEAGGQGGS